MYKLALVGDLSGGDPARLARVLDAAIGASDYVVQLGDLHPAYDVVKARLPGGHLCLVPGNHDVAYDSLGFPRNWRWDSPNKEVSIVGIDNSNDAISDEGWAKLALPFDVKSYRFVAAHKSPRNLLSEDAAIITHVMGDGQSNADANKLVSLLPSNFHAMFCGHYHGHCDTSMFDLHGEYRIICEGRGGAAPELFFSLIVLADDAWTIHQVPVA